MPSSADNQTDTGTESRNIRRRVILLHGPPASGKLSTARCLADHLEAVILHNHLTFNLARTLFEIGDQRLLDLHRALRRVMLEHALAPTPREASPVPDIILTLVYAEPDSVRNVAEITRLIEATGAELLPFYLRCSDAKLLERVASPGRAAEGKLHTPDRLRDLLKHKRYPPLPHPDTRIIDNEDVSAEDAATEITRLLSADRQRERDLDR